ncbi:MAG: epoxyqueuosine reductase QueH [Kiritimatiellae bacterium]|nr:epoxyqueuosine reductase QueH [Kiritimatiellia bacterium]
MKELLLHACCGPCSTHCVRALRAAGREPVLFYSNSNIDTREEWEKRLDSLRKFAAAEGVRVVVDPWDGAAWEREVAAGFEGEKEGGARCDRCFRHNLQKAAGAANALGIESFSTTLTVSPHKSSAKVFAAGFAAEKEVAGRVARQTGGGDGDGGAGGGAKSAVFEPVDFKKKDGFRDSVAIAREFGLYRQNYCGCRFSKAAAEARAATRKKDSEG